MKTESFPGELLANARPSGSKSFLSSDRNGFKHFCLEPDGRTTGLTGRIGQLCRRVCSSRLF